MGLAARTAIAPQARPAWTVANDPVILHWLTGRQRSHVLPNGMALANLERVQTNVINGTDITTSGIDFFVQYGFEDEFGGDLSIGSEVTSTIEHDVGPPAVTAVSPHRFDNVDQRITLDFSCSMGLLDEKLTRSATVLNMLDNDPPRTAQCYDYDGFTRNACGRMFELSFTCTTDEL